MKMSAARELSSRRAFYSVFSQRSSISPVSLSRLSFSTFIPCLYTTHTVRSTATCPKKICFSSFIFVVFSWAFTTSFPRLSSHQLCVWVEKFYWRQWWTHQEEIFLSSHAKCGWNIQSSIAQPPPLDAFNEKFYFPFLSLAASLSRNLSGEYLRSMSSMQAAAPHVFVKLHPEHNSASANRARSKPVSVGVLIHSFILHRKQSRSSKRGLETSNFLDTLVFDALCSRLVAHNARLFNFFAFLILGGNNFLWGINRERSERKVITVHNYCCEYFGITMNNNDSKIL